MAGSPDDTDQDEAARLASRVTEPLDVRSGRPGSSHGPGHPDAARETVRLPGQRGGGLARPGGGRRAPLPVAAAVAALWAALASYLPVAAVLALVALVGGESSSGGAARLAMAGWLLAHGVPLGTAAGPLGLVPLTVAALAAWRLTRAGVHATRAIGARRTGSVGRALAVAGAVGIGYGGIGALAAVLAAGAGVTVGPLRAALTLAGFAAVAAGFGALRCTGALLVLGLRTPPVLRDGLRTGLVAAMLVLGAGAALAGVALALRGGPASDTLAAYRTGVAGQAGVALVCAAYAPNLAVWAAAYLVGPGFALGSGTAVRATEVTVGALPAVPTFAALPDGPLAMAGTVLLGAPFLAGVVAGWLLARRRRRDPAARGGSGRGGPARGGSGRGGSGRGGSVWGGSVWGRLAGAAIVAGPVAGFFLGLAALASSGALGAGRLADIGPAAWPVGAVGAGVVAAGALVGALTAQAMTPVRR